MEVKKGEKQAKAQEYPKIIFFTITKILQLSIMHFIQFRSMYNISTCSTEVSDNTLEPIVHIDLINTVSSLLLLLHGGRNIVISSIISLGMMIRGGQRYYLHLYVVIKSTGVLCYDVFNLRKYFLLVPFFMSLGKGFVFSLHLWQVTASEGNAGRL